MGIRWFCVRQAPRAGLSHRRLSWGIEFRNGLGSHARRAPGSPSSITLKGHFGRGLPVQCSVGGSYSSELEAPASAGRRGRERVSPAAGRDRRPEVGRCSAGLETTAARLRRTSVGPSPPQRFSQSPAVAKATAAERSRGGLRPPANRTSSRLSPDSLCSAAISGPRQEASPLRQRAQGRRPLGWCGTG